MLTQMTLRTYLVAIFFTLTPLFANAAARGGAGPGGAPPAPKPIPTAFNYSCALTLWEGTGSASAQMNFVLSSHDGIWTNYSMFPRLSDWKQNKLPNGTPVPMASMLSGHHINFYMNVDKVGRKWLISRLVGHYSTSSDKYLEIGSEVRVLVGEDSFSGATELNTEASFNSFQIYCTKAHR